MYVCAVLALLSQNVGQPRVRSTSRHGQSEQRKGLLGLHVCFASSLCMLTAFVTVFERQTLGRHGPALGPVNQHLTTSTDQSYAHNFCSF